MDKKDYAALFRSLHPGHFDRPDIKELPGDIVFEEMILPLAEFDIGRYPKSFGGDVTFGIYRGSPEALREAVAEVDEGWVQFFDENSRVYCGYVGADIAGFCIIDDMGTHSVNGRTIKAGGPGCVGTRPEYRGKGIGLAIVANATEILKNEGFDISYIHYTHVAPWYAKLGYRTVVKWGRDGIIEQ
ncbi:MAG: GNAT family N-acetyltransferase [Ruminiclostridium sp.]|nr:GNAT family N-acetyltransferase [Ruminiclostridium sp.]